MFSYCFMLSDESKELCTINTPHGLYRYTRLPMGIKVSPDYAQSVIMKILDGLDVAAYIDDCGLWTDGSFEDHLKLVNEVLKRLLADANMKCNPLNCDWFIQETDFLGHWMTPKGVKPMRKKIDAVLKMGRPENQSQVRSFIGCVNFYRSMFP